MKLPIFFQTPMAVPLGATTLVFVLAGCGGGSGGGSPTPASDVRAIATQIRTQTNVPGLSGALISSDSIRLASVGIRRVGATTSVADTDLWSIASCTKPLTALLAARLVESGKISFETTLGEAFPRVRVHPDLAGATLRQLLGHRGGLATFTEGEELLSAARFSGNPCTARQNFAEFLLTQPPEFAVGSFHYSNAGYALAGAMLENAANDSWENLLETRVLSPLGVNTAKYDWPAAGFASATNPPQPWGHLEEGADFVPNDPNDPENIYNTPIPALDPSGGRTSLKIEDFARTAQLDLRGLRGQNGILKAETIARLHTPLEGNVYSQGWVEVTIDGQKLSLCDGSADPFFAVSVIVPSRNLAAVAVANAGGEKGTSAAYALVGKLLGITDFERKIGAALASLG